MSVSDVKSLLLMPLLLVLLFMSAVVEVQGHGRLMNPPSRSSMWRFGYATPVNYQDMELFCGGIGVQYGQNGGKCGVCGDPWNGPRDNEAGGKFGHGIIVRKYDVGQVINVTVDLTANHKGYFEFHICPLNNPFEKATEECLAAYPLVEVSTRSVKYPVPNIGYQGKLEMKLRLPDYVKCRACTFRWRYTAGNSWGTSGDGNGCIGCGEQEQFYGCADVAIGYDDVELDKLPVRHPWYFDSSTEWHYGIVWTNESTTKGAAAHIFTYNTLSSIWFLAGINLFIAVFVSFATT